MSERCPFCDARDCDKHLLLCSDADEGISGGALYGEEEALEEALREAIEALRLSGRKPPADWPEEWTSLYDELAAIPMDELFDRVEEDGEISSAPGLSWSGSLIYARTPETLLERFNAEVSRLMRMAEPGTRSTT